MTSAAKWKGWSDWERGSISSSFPAGTYTHVRTSSIHVLIQRARTRTLKHEMNMSGVNFDWHFHGVPKIYSGCSTYRNELLANKKNKDCSRSRCGELASLTNHRQSNNSLSIFTHTTDIAQRWKYTCKYIHTIYKHTHTYIDIYVNVCV